MNGPQPMFLITEMKLEAADRDKRDGLMAEILENSCPLQSKVNKGDRDALGGMTFFWANLCIYVSLGHLAVWILA